MVIDWTVIKSLNENRATKLAAMKALLDKADTEKRSLNADESAKWDVLKAEAEDLKAQVDRHNSLYQLTDEQRAAVQTQLDIPEKDIKRYSLMKAIRQAINGPMDGIEKEMHDELSHRNGMVARGFWLPYQAFATRDVTPLNTTTGTGLKEAVTGTFIDLLRAKTLTSTLGAQLLSGLVGNVSLPAMTAGATAQWLSEGVSPSGSNTTVGQVALSSKRISCFTDISDNLLNQTSADVEAIVRNDLTQAVATAIDLAAFNGSGSGAEPKGILQNTDVETVSIGTTGGALTYAKVVELESKVAANNADIGALAYATNSKVKGAAKTIVESAAVGAPYLWHSDNSLNGYPAYATNLIPSNLTKSTSSNLSALVYGNWNDLLIGLWGGGLQISVDTTTQALAGAVRIIAKQQADIALRRATSFAKIVDITTV